MAFTRTLIQGFRSGANLIAPADQLPEGGVRLLENARLTRLLGVITNRAGMVARTATAIATGSVRSIWTLFGRTENTRYAHVGTEWYRLTNTWSTPTLLEPDIGSPPVSGANMIDGEEGLYAYFVNSGSLTPHKDDGTTWTTMGVEAPSDPPLEAALATDLFTQITVFDSAVGWTATALTAGPTEDTTIKQEGTGSITITIAASTLGSLAQAFAVNLKTLTGGIAAIQDDDYIHLWVRADRPERLSYLQLDFDLDTAVVADAFKDNFYSINLPSLVWLEQGRDQWSKIQVAKSRFTRAGTSTALTWAHVKCVRLSALTTSAGAVQLWLDDWKLRGGTDLVGSVRYTVVYRVEATGARGNPPQTQKGVTRYTAALDVDRQRVNVTISNVISGGAAHPGTAQIDQMRIYRSIDEADALEIAEVADTITSPYLDEITIVDTLLAAVLETDNNVPPNGDFIFGPGATNRLFMLVGRSSLRFSKAWELSENRAENWPLTFEANIGDGSERALMGLVSDSTIFVWSDQRTYVIQGSGEDTFLPIAVPNSRGAVSRQAVTEGDGRIFFVSQDGIYQQVGQQQHRLTDAIAPFFAGLTVFGQQGWNPAIAPLSAVRLAWQSDVLGPFLLMLYCPINETVPSRELYLGRNVTTGNYTDISFDRRGGETTLRALHRDPETNRLYGGGTDGHVYHLEEASTETDGGVGMPWRVVTRSEHLGTPQQEKYVSQALVEIQTNSQPLTCLALYDKQQVTEVLSTIVYTTNATSTVLLPVADPEVMRQDMALDLAGIITRRVELSRYGWMAELQPEALTSWESGQQDFGTQTLLQGLWYTVMSNADIAVAVWLDARLHHTYHIPSTANKRDADRLFYVPGSKGRLGRVTLTSAEPFRLYALFQRSKPYGAGQAYQDYSLLQSG